MKSHTGENIKLLRRFYDAASRGEFDRVRDALDLNVKWIEPNVTGLWFSGIHHGPDAVWTEVISPTLEKIDNFQVHMKNFYAVGDHIIAIGYFHGWAKATSKELDAATAHVCTMRNGKIVRFEAFHDAAKWLDALGLVHPEAQGMAA